MTEIARRPDEVRGLSDLAFGELRDAVGGIGAVHQAIAKRAFDAVGPGGAPARVVHDAVSAGVYAGLRGGSALLGRGAGELLGSRVRSGERELSTTRRGSAVLGALNGLVGDQLERRGERPSGADVGPDRRPRRHARAGRARRGVPGRDADASWCSSMA